MKIAIILFFYLFSTNSYSTEFPILESVIQTRITSLELIRSEEYDDRFDNNQRLGNEYELEQVIGTRGSQLGEFLLPLKVAIHDSRMYVVDFGNQRIQVLQLDGTPIQILDLENLQSPIDLKFHDGKIYVLDFGQATLLIYDQDYKYLRRVSRRGVRAGLLNAPDNLAIDPRKLLWVSDQNNNRIEVFTETPMFSRTNNFFMNVSEYQPNTYLRAPKGVTYDHTRKEALVIDSGTARVFTFDMDGNYRTTLDFRGGSGGSVMMPNALVVDSAGNYYVSDHVSHMIQKFDGEAMSMGGIGIAGQFSKEKALTTTPESEPASPKTSYFYQHDSTFSFPQGLFVDKFGDLYVCDWGNNQVKKFSGSFYRKGMNFYRKKMFVEAIENFKRCKPDNPKYHLVEFYLAMCHYYLGELERNFANKIEWYKHTRQYLESLKLKSEIGKFENQQIRDLSLYYLSRVESYHMEE